MNLTLVFYQKIYRWFYGHKSVKKSDVSNGLQELFNQIHASSSKQGRKASAFQYYQSQYWNERIAPSVPHALETAYSKAIQEGKDLTRELKKSIRMSVHQEATRLCWEKDSQDAEFKAKIESETAAANAAQEAEFEKLTNQAYTAEDYAQYVLYFNVRFIMTTDIPAIAH